MPYPNIVDIRYATVKSQLYFLDTNIWLSIVNQFETKDAKNFTAYNNFCNQIFASGGELSPKIILCNLQVSEIINAYLRQVAMRRYVLEQKVENPSHDYYKMVYRTTDHFIKQHKLIRDEIKSYSSYLQAYDDLYTKVDPYKILNDLNPKMDYNDYYYYKFCEVVKNAGDTVSIVTHDQDFKFKEVEIITDNRILKDLRYQP